LAVTKGCHLLCLNVFPVVDSYCDWGWTPPAQCGHARAQDYLILGLLLAEKRVIAAWIALFWAPRSAIPGHKERAGAANVGSGSDLSGLELHCGSQKKTHRIGTAGRGQPTTGNQLAHSQARDSPARAAKLSQRGPKIAHDRARHSAARPENSLPQARNSRAQARNKCRAGVWLLPDRETCAKVVHPTYGLNIDEPIRASESTALSQNPSIVRGYLSRNLLLRCSSGCAASCVRLRGSLREADATINQAPLYDKKAHGRPDFIVM